MSHTGRAPLVLTRPDRAPLRPRWPSSSLAPLPTAPAAARPINVMCIEIDGTGVSARPAEIAGTPAPRHPGKQSDRTARTREVKLGCIHLTRRARRPPARLGLYCPVTPSPVLFLSLHPQSGGASSPNLASTSRAGESRRGRCAPSARWRGGSACPGRWRCRSLFHSEPQAPELTATSVVARIGGAGCGRTQPERGRLRRSRSRPASASA